MSGEVNTSDLDFEAGSSRQNRPSTSGGRFGNIVDEYKSKIDAAEKEKKFEVCLDLCSEATCVVPSEREFLLLKARFLVLTSRFDAANDVLGEVLKENPLNAEAIYVLGMIFSYRGNLKKSIEVFDNALQIDSGISHAIDMKEKAFELTEIFKKRKKI
jgi:tetratricopeptide (TPR) repeat protein